MKLTVGSLPSAVYWRRRAVVLGGMLVVVLLLWGSCSGSDSSDKTSRVADVGNGGASKTSTALLTPTTGSPPSAGSSATVAPSSSAPAVEGQSDTCADSELRLTPVAEPSTVPRGQAMQLVLKVKNISSRTCKRDLGADAQELYLVQGSTKVWSSDACDALHGTSVRQLSPNEEQAFTARWNGRSTGNGCADQPVPEAGEYQLIARLGAKTSAPVTLTLT